MRICRFVLAIIILSIVFTGCSYLKKAPSLSSQDAETDLTISLKNEYYFDENTNTLVYFAKDQDSNLFNLVLVKSGQEKVNILSLPSIPDSFVIDGDWIYFSSESINPEKDSNYQNKMNKLKEISKFFGDSIFNLFRINLETKEKQWLCAASSCLLDDKYIYFFEVPIDLDQYGLGGPKGCVFSNSSLCRMEKDGSNPALVSIDKNQILKITEKYIYTRDYRIDKLTFREEKMPSEYDYDISGEVYYLDKMFYAKWDSENEVATVYSYDLNTKTTVEIAKYSFPPEQIIPLENGGLIIWQSDSSKREIRQVAKIHFFDEDFKLEKTIEANGRYYLTIRGNKVFYILEEVNDGKSIYSYMDEETYSTHTLCSDDLSMQGENVMIVDIIDDSVYY